MEMGAAIREGRQGIEATQKAYGELERECEAWQRDVNEHVKAKVRQLLSKDLTNLPGSEGLVLTVEYPPGSSDFIHHHNAHAFVYVLEGSIMMQLRGGKETTLTPGQTFYRGSR